MPPLDVLTASMRRHLVAAGLFMVPLFFWLPAHEVFELPKATALLVYACLLAACSLPLATSPQWRNRALRPWLWAGGALLLASTASLLNAWRLVPANTSLCLERLAALWACALSALVIVLDTAEFSSRALWVYTITSGILCFYGLIQLLDQTLGRSLGFNLDLIRWTSFGESRVYSSMGNPDYMSAHLTMLFPFYLALGPRRARLRSALKVSCLALVAAPLALLFATGNQAGLPAFAAWALLCALLFVLLLKLPERGVWLGFLYLIAGLIVVAQGRAAYIGFLAAGLAFGLGLVRWGRATLGAHRRFLWMNAGAACAAAVLALGLLAISRHAPDLPLVQWPPAKAAIKVADSLVSRLDKLKNPRDEATVVRTFYYRAALRLALQHPLLGIGLGNHALFTARAQSELWKKWDRGGNPNALLVEPHVELYTHNDFLQNFAETGLLGLAAFLTFWGWLLARSIGLTRREGARGFSRGTLALGLAASAVAFLASAMFNFPWRVLTSLQWCWLAFAWMARLDAVPQTETAPAGLPAAKPVPFRPLHWAVMAAMLAAALAAAVPARWFLCSILMRQGNLARDRNDPAAASKFYGKAARSGMNGTEAIELLLYQGSMENLLGRADQAAACFEKGISYYPDFLEAHYNLGYTRLSLFEKTHDPADRQAAEDEFKKVLEIDPRYTNALNNLGNIYFAERNLDSALATYQTLLRYKQDGFEPYFNLGSTYLLLHRKKDAQDAFEKSWRLNPGYTQARVWYQKLKALPDNTRLEFH